jgi:hypothetical protein
VERRLTAILCADVCGCGRLMGEDEGAKLNVAALENLAEPGGIRVLGIVHNQVCATRSRWLGGPRRAGDQQYRASGAICRGVTRNE